MEPYPLFIEVKPRYFDTNVIAYDPKTKKCYIVWLCYKIPTSWDVLLISPLITALANLYVQSLGLTFIQQTFSFWDDDITDYDVVYQGGMDCHRSCCDKLFNGAILTDEGIRIPSRKPIDKST